MITYLDEFLYRGRSPDDQTPPGWHLNIVDVADQADEFGNRPQRTRQLSMTQMVAAGLDVPAVLSQINKETMIECERLRNTVAARDADIVARDQRIADLEDKVKALSSPVPTPVPAGPLTFFTPGSALSPS